MLQLRILPTAACVSLVGTSLAVGYSSPQATTARKIKSRSLWGV